MPLRSLLPLGALLFPACAAAQSCSFSVTGVNFGSIDTLAGTAIDATGTINITCSAGPPGDTFRVCLHINAGSGGATSGTRQMRNASNAALNYNLYQNAARTVPWGSSQNPTLGNPVTLDLTASANGSVSATQTIYARISASQQTAATGLYSSAFSGVQVRFNYRTYNNNPQSCANISQNPVSPAFIVQANLAPTCRVTAQNIDFGSHGLLDAQVDAAGMLDISCTPGTSYTAGLNNGLTGTAPTQRRMTRGSEAVVYGLYKDANRTQPWGNSGGTLVPGVGAGAAQNLRVYGRVPPQATPSPGTYTDTVVVTLTY